MTVQRGERLFGHLIPRAADRAEPAAQPRCLRDWTLPGFRQANEAARRRQLVMRPLTQLRCDAERQGIGTSLSSARVSRAMINGVRASSTSTLSASSTMARPRPRSSSGSAAAWRSMATTARCTRPRRSPSAIRSRR
jgi:hypothetical protein